jgi:hypothetical protein
MTVTTTPVEFIDEGDIITALIAGGRADESRVHEILAKAGEARGLEMDEVAALSTISDPELLGELFATAREVKETIYGRRLVLFAPLYVSNLCSNDCLYCAFRVRNKELTRRALTQGEIRREVEITSGRGTSASCSWPASPTRRRASATSSTRSPRSTKSSATTARSAASTSTSRPSPSTSSRRSRAPASARISSSRRPTTARPTARCMWGQETRL